MGVDLTILPNDWTDSSQRMHSYGALHFSRDRRLWNAIENSKIEKEVPAPVTCHFSRTEDGETCFGEVENCPYGNRLTWSTAKELADALSPYKLAGNNIWIMAAIKAMDPDHKIIFYWH